MAELLPLGSVIDTIIARQTAELRRPRPLPLDQSLPTRDAERSDRVQPDDRLDRIARARDDRAADLREDRVADRRDEVAQDREFVRRLQNDRFNDELFQDQIDERVRQLQQQLDRDELREIGRGAIVDIEA